MRLVRNLILISLLLLIVWASFLAVTYVMASTMFPALEKTDGDIALSISRTIMGLTVFGLWVYACYLLTRFWLYRVLLAET